MKVKIPLVLSILSCIVFIYDFINTYILEKSLNFLLLIHTLLDNLINIYSLFFLVMIFFLFIWSGKKMNYKIIMLSFILILASKIYNLILNLFINSQYLINLLLILITIICLINIILYFNKYKINKYIFIVSVIIFSLLNYQGNNISLSIILNILTIISIIPYFKNIKYDKKNKYNNIEFKLSYSMLSLTGLFILIIMLKSNNIYLISSIGCILLIASNILTYLDIYNYGLLLSLLNFVSLFYYEIFIIKDFSLYSLFFIIFSLFLFLFYYKLLYKNKFQLKV